MCIAARAGSACIEFFLLCGKNHASFNSAIWSVLLVCCFIKVTEKTGNAVFTAPSVDFAVVSLGLDAILHMKQWQLESVCLRVCMISCLHK